MSTKHYIEIAFDNPANAAILRKLSAGPSVSVARKIPSASPDSIENPDMRLGTHPELVARLWNGVTQKLPTRCDWIVHGAPVLARPDTGIIFAFAGGTSIYALRLPPAQRDEMAAAALAKATQQSAGLAPKDARDRYIRAFSGEILEFPGGIQFDVRTLGKEWVLGRWLKSEEDWCLAAYEFAGQNSAG